MAYTVFAQVVAGGASALLMAQIPGGASVLDMP